MMTEDEARKKFCVQSMGDEDCDQKCIASACMAWRTGHFEHQRNLPEADRTPNVGYCGLAGAP